MKVKELIKHLKGLNQEARVFLSSDEEGNNYNPLAEGNFCFLEGNFDKDKKNPMSKYDNWSLDEEEKSGDYIILFPLY